MLKFLKTVTVTGADDSVHPAQLVQLAEEYSFVEFGILLSKHSMGLRRFPSAEWLKILVRIARRLEIHLAAHFCGEWVRDILGGDWPRLEIEQIHPKFMNVFSRVQLNTHGVWHPFDGYRLAFILRELTARNKEVIFQNDTKNNHLIMWAIGQDFKISALFDCSHGGGILPESWPTQLDYIRCGYAGALGPDNLPEQLEKIEKVIVSPIWVDSETKLRSNNDRQFDLEKVRAFLELAKPWVINQESQND
jgi:hypothetical protein